MQVNAMTKLTRVEAETTFQLIDIDGNGAVEANELHELLFSVRPPAPKPPPPPPGLLAQPSWLAQRR